MSWTASITSIGPDSAGIAIEVLFTSSDNPPRTMNQIFHFKTESTTEVQNAIQSQINVLTSQDSLLAGITPGPFTPPTNSPMATSVYAQAQDLLAQVNAAVSAGAILASDPSVKAAQQIVSSSWALISAGVSAEIATLATQIASVSAQAQNIT